MYGARKGFLHNPDIFELDKWLKDDAIIRVRRKKRDCIEEKDDVIALGGGVFRCDEGTCRICPADNWMYIAQGNQHVRRDSLNSDLQGGETWTWGIW